MRACTPGVPSCAQPLPELPGRTCGERHRQHALCVDHSAAYGVRDAVGDGARLARARSGEHADRPPDGFRHVTLLGIQPRQNVVGLHGDSLHAVEQAGGNILPATGRASLILASCRRSTDVVRRDAQTGLFPPQWGPNWLRGRKKPVRTAVTVSALALATLVIGSVTVHTPSAAHASSAPLHSSGTSTANRSRPRATRRPRRPRRRRPRRRPQPLVHGTVVNTVSYGPHVRQRMDVWYQPDELKRPGVFVIHGGWWSSRRQEVHDRGEPELRRAGLHGLQHQLPPLHRRRPGRPSAPTRSTPSPPRAGTPPCGPSTRTTTWSSASPREATWPPPWAPTRTACPACAAWSASPRWSRR